MEKIERGRLAWIAGVVEGEGCIHVKNATRYGSPTLRVVMTDEDVIRRLHSWAGVGTVEGPRTLPSGKRAWTWDVRRLEDVRAILEALLPWLGDRRKLTASLALAIIEDRPPLKGTETHCAAGHPFSGGNLVVYVEPSGYRKRRCRECINARARKSRAKIRA